MLIGDVLQTLLKTQEGNPCELTRSFLTTKGEGTIRNRFTGLIGQGSNGKHFAANEAEGKRIDTVEYRQIGKYEFLPTDLYEFSYWYTFDIIDTPDKVVNKIKNEFVKLDNYSKPENRTKKFKQAKANPYANHYAVIVDVRPIRGQEFPLGMEAFIKYIDKQNKFIREFNSIYKRSSQELTKKVRSILEFNFGEGYKIKHSFYLAGREFDCDVEVHFWVIQKDRRVKDCQSKENLLKLS